MSRQRYHYVAGYGPDTPPQASEYTSSVCAYSAEGAAEEAAEKSDDNDYARHDEQTIWIRDAAGQVSCHFVTLEFDPRYTARRVTP